MLKNTDAYGVGLVPNAYVIEYTENISNEWLDGLDIMFERFYMVPLPDK